jgi:hypothetical protein
MTNRYSRGICRRGEIGQRTIPAQEDAAAEDKGVARAARVALRRKMPSSGPAQADESEIPRLSSSAAESRPWRNDFVGAQFDTETISDILASWRAAFCLVFGEDHRAAELDVK